MRVHRLDRHRHGRGGEAQRRGSEREEHGARDVEGAWKSARSSLLSVLQEARVGRAVAATAPFIKLSPLRMQVVVSVNNASGAAIILYIRIRIM